MVQYILMHCSFLASLLHFFSWVRGNRQDTTDEAVIVPQGYIGNCLLYHKNTLTQILDFGIRKVTPPHQQKSFVHWWFDPLYYIYNPQQTTTRYKNCV